MYFTQVTAASCQPNLVFHWDFVTWLDEHSGLMELVTDIYDKVKHLCILGLGTGAEKMLVPTNVFFFSEESYLVIPAQINYSAVNQFIFLNDINHTFEIG